MKHIKYAKEFKGADGQPFTVIDPDVTVLKAARVKAMAEWDKKAAESLRKGLPEPKEASWPAPTIECDFAQAMTWFMNNIPFSDEVDADGKAKPPRKLTAEDAGNAYAVIKAFKGAKDGGTVEMEDAVYKWLVEIVKLDGIEAFKPLATQAIVTERLSDVIKEETKK